METINEIIGTLTAASLILFIYVWIHRGDKKYAEVEREFYDDYEVTIDILSICTPPDGERIIRSFSDRWTGIIPELELIHRLGVMRGIQEAKHPSMLRFKYSPSQN